MTINKPTFDAFDIVPAKSSESQILVDLHVYVLENITSGPWWEMDEPQKDK